MQKARRLIEVAMPVKEVSAESVRDKSIRHGHISTLHLWWARRPLPVCRAVVFASIVPDPLDKECPGSFKDAVKELLKPQHGHDPYQPYDDIPYTTVEDPMEDNLRNRLQMFIGKFSENYIKNEILGKKTPSKEIISENSLIKWENKNNKKILKIARKLIWVAHNAEQGDTRSYKELSADFDKHFTAIKEAEEKLYSLPDRHKRGKGVKEKEEHLRETINRFLDRMPTVFDPFAGGGAIPLEAARLGCRSYGNDINPVAHIIQKGSLEFPQKYGKPITFSQKEFISLYGNETIKTLPPEVRKYSNGKDLIELDNRLAFDVEYFAKDLLSRAEKEIGKYYPPDEKGNKPVAYYWARVGKCENPSCGAEVPLLGRFYLVNKPGKKVFLKPIINGKQINFTIEKDSDYDEEGWINRGNLSCPVCGNITEVKKLKNQFLKGKEGIRLLAVIWEGKKGKTYTLPRQEDIDSIKNLPDEIDQPQERMPVKYTQALPSCTWGLEKWGQMFTNRQLLSMQTLVSKLNEIKEELKANPAFNDPGNMEDGGLNGYGKALVTYLGIWIDRIAIGMTSFGRIDVTRENLQTPFSRQAIPMMFDFPESNPFCESSGSALNQLSWITRYLLSESKNPFQTICKNSSSGDIEQFEKKQLDVVVTDPPYYDAIAYADLSDFFYVWLKRTITDIYPLNFAFPQTPKTEECTALKHHHEGNANSAKEHFEKKLLSIFKSIEHQTSGLISIMFAHQSTEAWTTLCNSILGANMNISSSWALDTELGNRMVAMEKAALASSVTVSCKPVKKEGFGSYKEIRENILHTVKEEVKFLIELGFRGADLLTACFGKAVREFGKYEKVEKSDGTEVTVEELLNMAREAAFNAIVSDIDADEFTRFYIGWLNLFGFTEATHDDVRRITQIGLKVDSSKLLTKNLLIREGNKERLAQFKERLEKDKRLGLEKGDATIDKVHRAMELFRNGNRRELVVFIKDFMPDGSPEWRVLQSLTEVLPAGLQDHKQAQGLLTNKDSLIREAKQSRKKEQKQTTIF